jgi:hypothetical protein
MVGAHRPFHQSIEQHGGALRSAYQIYLSSMVVHIDQFHQSTEQHGGAHRPFHQSIEQDGGTLRSSYQVLISMVVHIDHFTSLLSNMVVHIDHFTSLLSQHGGAQSLADQSTEQHGGP